MRSIRKHWWFLVALVCTLPGCAGMPATDSSCTVAVWELEHLGSAGGHGAEMGPLLTAKVMEGLETRSACGIVERQKLDRALSELALGASQLTAESTRLRIGQIAGARQMVFGAYQVFGPHMRVDLRLVDVSTGTVLRTAEKSGSSTEVVQWMRVAQEAAEQLAEDWPR